MWLWAYDSSRATVEKIGREFNLQVRDRWIPIYPKLGVEYAEVLDCVVAQLKEIANIAGTLLSVE